MLPLTICKIKKLADVATPEYKTAGAAAFDLAASVDTNIAPHEHKLVPTGLVIGCPTGHYMSITPRSSLFKNFGLILVNSPGVLDEDYCGDEDQVFLSLFNLKPEEAKIKAGDRLCQGVFLRYTKARFDEVDDMGVSRGGFGSTGLS